jgi:hypothetical protein
MFDNFKILVCGFFITISVYGQLFSQNHSDAYERISITELEMASYPNDRKAEALVL